MALKLITTVILIVFCGSFSTAQQQQQCGEIMVGKQLSTGSVYADRGQWPWLAPLFEVANNKFFCGSSIISQRHLVTASHCIQDKNVNSPRSADSIFAMVGRYNLDIRDEVNATKFFLHSIALHPDWDKTTPSYDADIAVLTLKGDITFTDYVQPICLPTPTDNVFKLSGTIAGYGLSENSQGQHEKRPKFVEIKSVTQEECRAVEDAFTKIGSARTFCAGERGKSPCSGDSGSGFYVKTSKKYTLIGVVSAATYKDCAEYDFVLFTSVPKFVAWLAEILREERKTEKDGMTLECNFKPRDDYLFTLEDSSHQCHNTNLQSSSPNLRISTITGNFDYANINDIKTIAISGGSVTYIPDFTHFTERFPKFDRLLIVSSGLKHIERRQMAKMPQLVLVNFFGNGLDYLPEDSFNDLVSLKWLGLVANNIKVLPPKLLWNLPNLQEIWTWRNSYEIIPSRFFKNNKQIEIILMNAAQVSQISVNFKALPKLKTLDLRENKCINEIACESCEKKVADLQEIVDEKCESDRIAWVDLDTVNHQRTPQQTQWVKLSNS